MIKLTQQTAQDFLSKYWVQKIQEAGQSMESGFHQIFKVLGREEGQILQENLMKIYVTHIKLWRIK